MSTLAQPTLGHPRAAGTQRTRRPSTAWYWVAAIVAIAGLTAGLWFGVDNYRDAQRHLDSFDRLSVPGQVTLSLPEETSRVVYYEGDKDVRFNDLAIRISDPGGAPIAVDRYEGEMIYETLDFTQGRAVATFRTDMAGPYRLEVSGMNEGQLTVGDNFSRRAIPGVLAGLGIVVLGLVLWLVTLIKRQLSPGK